jgi:hypothetical protein
MKPHKKDLNRYPDELEDVSLYDFMTRSESGMPKIIEFMNVWARDLPRLNDFMLVRYEDLKEDPHEVLRAILQFIGTPGSDSQIQEAVEFGSYEKMKAMEDKGSFWLSGGRMKPRDRANPDSFKVRRAKVGGYRDYLNDEQINEIDALINATLSPTFGYGSRPRGSARSMVTDRATLGSQTS